MTFNTLIAAIFSLLLVGCKVSDQLDRQYYNKREAPHMMSIADMSQPMVARALVDQHEVFGQRLEPDAQREEAGYGRHIPVRRL